MERLRSFKGDFMAHNFIDEISEDGIDRRGFLKCMAWAGAGLVYTAAGGVLSSRGLGAGIARADGMDMGAMPTGLSFAQISDSHIGFSKEANKDVVATLQIAVDRINALPQPPAFVLHTGDLSHLAKPEEFDTLQQVLKGIKTDRIFYVPGEHDMLNDDGATYLARYGQGTKGTGWYSFDHSGIHFIGLVNVVNLKAGGLGSLGQEQLDWLEDDVKGLSNSTPIVVFAHIPLWSVYPQWGWGTDDGAQALGYLKRFGSLTVLNGHIHQTLQKVEGNITFHTARSTAFPQPAPGMAASPGPMKVPAGQLAAMLGIANVHYVEGNHSLAIVDSSLQAAAMPAGAQVTIDNFAFSPAVLRVTPGTQVTWINRDDIPHTVVSTDKLFASKALDTDDRFSFTFTAAGTYPYFCSVHPHMTAKIVVG